MPHESFKEGFSEEKVNAFFEEHLFNFSDIWAKTDYRILATKDEQLIALAFYLLPKGKTISLPSAKPPIAEPFQYYKGSIPFNKATIVKIINQFIKEPPCYLDFASHKFFICGTPQSNIEYVNFFQPLDGKPYDLSFPIVFEKRIEDTEAKMLRYFYELSENRIKKQSGLSLEDHIRKWIGDSTKFFKPADYSAVGTYLTIHAPVWIRFSNKTILHNNNLNFDLTGPKGVKPSRIRCTVESNGKVRTFQLPNKANKFPVNSKIEISFEPKKISLQLFSKNTLIQKSPLFNTGLLNPKVKLLETIQTKKGKRKLSIDERLAQEASSSVKRFEQYIIDLFSSLGFSCIHIGEDSTKPDVASFFEGKNGRTECFIIECSEAGKEHPKIITFLDRWKELKEKIDCQSYPMFITNSKAEPNVYGDEFKNICILAREDLLELEKMAKRNEILEKIIDYLMFKTKFKSNFYLRHMQPEPKEEATVSIFLDFDKKQH